MNPDDPRLLAIAAAISDGERIDWPGDGEGSDAIGSAVRALKIVADVAAACRATDGSEDTPTVTEPAPPTERSPQPAAASTASAPSLPGFRIARRLGEGGMGIVYEAEQLHPHRPVALKVIRAGAHADAVTLKMFEREMQTLARLKHPGIAAIYESGTTPEGLPYYTMELVRGENLGEHLKRRTQDAGDLPYRLELFRKICEAVAYAHQRGIIHRDLKPSNVLVLRDPGSPTSLGPVVSDIKVLDFGLARIADPEGGGSMMSEIGSVKGTLAYMSPEQARGNPDEIDLRTDVYSLGVMLYEIVSGCLPYDISKGGLHEAVRAITDDPPKPITRTWGGSTKLDADITTIIGKALEKEPSRRYSTAEALAEDIQRHLTNQPIQARRPSAAYQLRKLVARHKLVFTFAAVLFVVLAASTVGLAVQARRIAHERDRASQEAETAGRVSEFLVSLFRVSDPGESRGNTITAREILDSASERIGRELKDQPVVRARMLDTIGNVYRSLGLYSRAEPLLQEGLRTRESILGAKHPDVALSRNSLAHSLVMHGQDAAGEREAKASLEILAANGMSDSEAAAWALYHLGDSRANQADHAGAKESFEKARALFERHLGHDSLPVAWCLEDLGRSRALAGDLRDALSLSEEALRIKESVLGANHPDVAMGLNNVGYLRMHLGDIGMARPILERALALGEASFGPEHRATANILESLGDLSLQSGDLPRARATLERALAIFQKQVQPDAYDNALVQVTLGRVLVAQGELDRAGRLFEASLAAHDRTGCLGSEAVTLYEAYADYLKRRGRDVEAAQFEARAAKAK